MTQDATPTERALTGVWSTTGSGGPSPETVEYTRPILERALAEGRFNVMVSGYEWRFQPLDAERAARAEPGLREALTPDYCDCNYAPIRGIEAGRHLPSCRYGIIEDFLDAALEAHGEPPPVKATTERDRIEQAFIDGSVEGSPIDRDGRRTAHGEPQEGKR